MILPNTLRTSALFAREWVGRPTVVGAICPSSRRLASEIARQVPAGDGFVIELGGGTGAITQALLDSGISAERLIVVERSAAFANHLRHRFPNVPVICADAVRLKQFLPPNMPIDAIVSGLPLRSLPRTDTEAIVDQWHQVLNENGVVIQFTYDIRPRHALMADAVDFTIRSSRIVWANVPPARVVAMSPVKCSAPATPGPLRDHHEEEAEAETLR